MSNITFTHCTTCRGKFVRPQAFSQCKACAPGHPAAGDTIPGQHAPANRWIGTSTLTVKGRAALQNPNR